MKRKLVLPIIFPGVCLGLALAQAPTPAGSSLPSDPTALLQLAAQTNGLHGPGLQPWRAKATWQLLDPVGKAVAQGTLEEWWAGENQVKVEMTTSGFHQIRWSTEKGDFTTGDAGWPALPFALALDTLSGPLAGPQSVDKHHVRSGQPHAGSVSLRCIAYGSGSRLDLNDDSYCFAGDKSAVRLVETPVTQSAFNGIFQFHDRFLAREVHIVRVGMPAVEIYLEGVDDFQGTRDEWTPPPNAVQAGLWRNVPKGIVFAHRISGDMPAYPRGVAHPRERVTIEFTSAVGMDGRAQNVEFIGCPLEMQQPTLDVIKKWRFSHAMLNGAPVEILLTNWIVIEIDDRP